MNKNEIKEEETQATEKNTVLLKTEKAGKKFNGQDDDTYKKINKNVAFSSKSPDADIYAYPDAKSEFFQRLSTYNYLNAHNFIALDIERDKIKYLTGKVHNKAVQVLDHGVEISKTPPQDQETNLQYLLENIESSHYKSGMKVFVSFFNPEINIKQFALPKMAKRRDLLNAIRFKLEAEQSGFDEQSRWHYKIIEEFTEDGSDFYRILTVVVPGEVVDNLMEKFYKTGLKPDVLLPRPIAAYNAYTRMIDEIETDVLVDISYDMTHIYYITGNNLQYTRDIASGTINFEKAVHDDNKMLLPEKMAVKDGIAENGALRADKIRDALNMRLKTLQDQQDPALQLFKNELENSIQYFNKLQPQKPAKRIFITGYGIQKEGLMSFLKKTMKLPVNILAPRLNAWEKNVMIFGQYFGSLGSAFALKDAFDLVPKVYKKRKMYKRLNFLMGLVIILSAMGMFYLNNIIDKNKEDMQAQLADLNIQYDALHPIELEYNETKRQISELQAEQNNLLGLIKNRGPVIEAMKFLSNETPAQIVLSNFRIGEEKVIVSKNKRNRRQTQADKQRASQAAKDPLYSMYFTGNVTSDYLLSDITLINYVDHLKNLNMFKTVDLVTKDKKSSRQSMRFEIKVTL